MQNLCEQHPIVSVPVYPFLREEELPPEFKDKPFVLMEVDSRTKRCIRVWRGGNQSYYTAGTHKQVSSNLVPRKLQQYRGSSNRTKLSSRLLSGENKLVYPESVSGETSSSVVSCRTPNVAISIEYTASQWTAIAMAGTNREAVSSNDLAAKQESIKPEHVWVENIHRKDNRHHSLRHGLQRASLCVNSLGSLTPSRKQTAIFGRSDETEEDDFICMSGSSPCTLKRSRVGGHPSEHPFVNQMLSESGEEYSISYDGLVCQDDKVNPGTFTSNMRVSTDSMNVDDQLYYHQEAWLSQGSVPYRSESDPVWVLQFLSLHLKQELLRDLRFVESWLECLFEAVTPKAVSYITRRSMPQEIRDLLPGVLYSNHLYPHHSFFTVSHIRHCLFAIMEHCTDNSVLRDAIFLDLALDRLQQQLALQLLYKALGNVICSPVQDNYRCTRILSMPFANKSVSFQDSTHYRLNPVYILKEVCCCMISSLLTLHLEFSAIDCLHVDVASLLEQPSMDTVYGYAVQASLIHLRGNTVMNASMEQTQFARGFYQTQTHRKGFRKTYRFSMSPLVRPTAVSPFLIVPTIPELSQISSLQYKSCSRDEDQSFNSTQQSIPGSPSSRISHSIDEDTSQRRLPFVSPLSSSRSFVNAHDDLSNNADVECPLALGSTKPMTIEELRSLLASYTDMKQHLDNDPKYYEALIFLKSITERLDRLEILYQKYWG